MQRYEGCFSRIQKVLVPLINDIYIYIPEVLSKLVISLDTNENL